MKAGMIMAFMGLFALNSPASVPMPDIHTRLLSSHEISLNDRYSVPSVNGVFKDNILLNIAYMSDKITDPSHIDWDRVRKPFHYTLFLKPHEVFAFHDDVLPEFQGKTTKTTNAHFDAQEGFRSDGYLYGDGVCHLASLLYWVAKNGGLKTLAPANHNFSPIPGIPKEDGVAIYYYSGMHEINSNQNLYIENDLDNPVVFSFDYENDRLRISLYEVTGE